MTILELIEKKRTLSAKIEEIKNTAQLEITPLQTELNKLLAELQSICPHEHLSGGSSDDGDQCDDCERFFSIHDKEDLEVMRRRGR